MNEIVVYVHGIGQHPAGFSDPWFQAMEPHLSVTLDRQEVVWSENINPALRGTALSAMEETNDFFMLKNSI